MNGNNFSVRKWKVRQVVAFVDSGECTLRAAAEMVNLNG
jgi:hypothetical protein